MEVAENNDTKSMFTSISSVMAQTALLIPSVMVTKENLENPKQKMIYDLATSDYDPLLDSHLLHHNGYVAMPRPTLTSRKDFNHFQKDNSGHESRIAATENPSRLRTSSKRKSSRKSRNRGRKLIEEGLKEHNRDKTSSRAGKLTPLGRQIPRKGITSRHKIFPVIKANDSTVRNIKFWRGTTPINREKLSSFPPITIEGGDESMLAPQEPNRVTLSSPLQDGMWIKKYNVKETGNKAQHKFYERHLALRDRLIEYETMHYREAVTRINRYREKLRQRPLVTRGIITRNGKQLSLGKEKNVATKVHIVEPEPREQVQTSLSPPGVRMSPSKEWKPFVNKTQTIVGSKTQNEKPPRLIKPRRKMSPKYHQVNKGVKVKPHESPEPAMSYPILGEKLLRGKTPKTNTKSLGNLLLEDKFRSDKHGLVKGSAGYNIVWNKTVENQPTNAQSPTDSQKTQSLLVNLRKQLSIKPNSHDPNIDQTYRDKIEEIYADKPKTAVGTKLRLLLQASSQSERKHSLESGKYTDDHKAPATSQASRGTLKSQPLRPLASNHNTRFPLGGELRFPSVTKIGSVTIIQGKEGGKEFVMKGTRREVENKSEPENRSKEGGGSNHGQDKYQEDSNKIQDEINYAMKHQQNSYWRQNISNKKNDSNHQQSAPHQNDMQPAANHIPIKKDYKIQQERQENPKKHAKHKILRIAVVQPPGTAQEHARHMQILQQQKAQLLKARQALFDPAKLAVTNFTAAILNSELGLRAPSSSPVNMFLQRIVTNSRHGNEKNPTEFIQFNKPVSRQNTPRTPQTPSGGRDFTVNRTDGLSPGEEHARFEELNKIGPPPPKVADLIDLQRLYDVMRKHGESFASLPFALQSTLNEANLNGLMNHINREDLKKKPFYHYPYPYQSAKSAKNMGMPLYVVTGAKALGETQIKAEKVQCQVAPHKQMEQTRFNYNHTPKTSPRKEVQFKMAKPTPSPVKQTVAVQKDNSDGYQGIRSVTVSMVKPSVPSLEQIKEHSID